MNNGDAASVAALTGMPQETVQQIHDDFAYWYPVDLRTSGKDLVANHLLFFLYHHVAIFPERLWPKAIAVNGFVSLEGQKMSKSKGPLLTLRQAVAENGADVTRLYILGNAEGTADVDWRNDGVESTYAHLERFYNLAREILADSSIDESAEKTLIDRWMLSRLQRRIAGGHAGHGEHPDPTGAAECLLPALQRSALVPATGRQEPAACGAQRLGAHDVALHARTFARSCGRRAWARAMPRWPQWPVADAALIDPQAEKAEDLLERTLNDVQEIVNVTKATPTKITLYTTPAWKQEMLRLAVEAAAGRQAGHGSAHEAGHGHARPLRSTRRMRPSMPKSWPRRPTRSRRRRWGWTSSRRSPGRRRTWQTALGVPVEIYSADEAGEDPKGKSKQAEPGRPAIYIE